MNDVMLVALDYAGCAHEVAAEAASLAGRLKSEVVLLHVVHLPAGVPPTAVLHTHDEDEGHQALEVLTDDAKDELAQLAKLFTHGGVPVRIEVRQGDAAPAIVACAQHHQASMIVMGTHGRTGLRRLVLGSVAERVIRSAPCPVLVVRTQEAHPGRTIHQDHVEAESSG